MPLTPLVLALPVAGLLAVAGPLALSRYLGRRSASPPPLPEQAEFPPEGAEWAEWLPDIGAAAPLSSDAEALTPPPKPGDINWASIDEAMTTARSNSDEAMRRFLAPTGEQASTAPTSTASAGTPAGKEG